MRNRFAIPKYNEFIILLITTFNSKRKDYFRINRKYDLYFAVFFRLDMENELLYRNQILL